MRGKCGKGRGGGAGFGVIRLDPAPAPPYTGVDPGFATLIHLASSGLWDIALYEPKTCPPGAYTPVRRETMKNENRIQCHDVLSAAKKYSAG